MPDGKLSWWRPALATAVTVAAAIAFAQHQFRRWPLNATAPGGWVSAWQHLRTSEVFPWLLVALAPLIAAQFLWRRTGKTALLLLMVCLFAMQWLGACVRTDPFGVTRLIKCIRNDGSICYYATAQHVEQFGTISFYDSAKQTGTGGLLQALKDYPNAMPTASIHAREKPPGPVVYYYLFLKLFTHRRTAPLISAIGIALFTSLAVPGTYLMARSMLEDANAAFHAAACVCLAPGLTLFFPFFDPCYITVVSFMVWTWDRWLTSGKLRYAIAFAAIIFGVTFWAYNILVVGALLVAQIVYRWAQRGRAVAARAVLGGAITFGLVVGIYALLFYTIQFHPIATFRTAVYNQGLADAFLKRFYLNTMPTNLLGFFTGMGPGLVLTAVLAVVGRSWRQAGPYRATGMLIALGQIVVVAASGLLRSETARVWMLLSPLVAVPAGWEISRWSARWRLAYYASAWFLTVVCLQNMLTVS